MQAKQRKQWEKNSPIRVGGRVSYPVGDHRRNEEENDISPLEWTMRPDGNNFAVDRGKRHTPSKTFKATTTKIQHSENSDDNIHQLPPRREVTNVASTSLTQHCHHIERVDHLSSMSSSRNGTDTVPVGCALRNDGNMMWSDKHNVLSQSTGVKTADISTTSRQHGPCDDNVMMTQSDFIQCDDMLLGMNIWVPCQYNAGDKSVQWNCSKLPKGTQQAFFNVATRKIVLKKLLTDMGLMTKAPNNCFEVNAWYMCFMSRSNPDEVHWYPEEFLHQSQILPFFCSIQCKRNKEESCWNIPVTDCDPHVRNINEEVISFSIISCASISSPSSLSVCSESTMETPVHNNVKSFHTATQDPSLPLPSVRSPRDAFASLTHFRHSGDVLALNVAVGRCKVDDIFHISSHMNMIAKWSSWQNEWSNIVSQNQYQLMKELCHVIACNTEKGGMSVSPNSSAAECLYTVSLLCPIEFQIFICGNLTPLLSSSDACVCCGCSIGKVSTRRRSKKLNLCRTSYIIGFFISPFEQHLNRVVDKLTEIVNAYIKCKWSLYSSKARGDFDPVYSKSLDSELLCVMQFAALLLSIVSSTRFVEHSKSTESPTKNSALCCCQRCSRCCFLFNPCHAASSDNPNCEKMPVFLLISLLFRALEICTRIVELQAVSKASLVSKDEKTILSSLVGAGDKLCRSCAPLLPAVLNWCLSGDDQHACSYDFLANDVSVVQFLNDDFAQSRCLYSLQASELELKMITFQSLCRTINMVSSLINSTADQSNEEEVSEKWSLLQLLHSLYEVNKFLRNDTSTVVSDILGEEGAGLNIVRNTLCLVRNIHLHPLICSDVLSSYYVISCLIQIMKLLDFLLFSSNSSKWLNSAASTWLEEGIMEEFLLQLEDCLESLEEFRRKMRVMFSYESDYLLRSQQLLFFSSEDSPEHNKMLCMPVRWQLTTIFERCTRTCDLMSSFSDVPVMRVGESSDGQNSLSEVLSNRLASYSSDLIGLLSKCYS